MNYGILREFQEKKLKHTNIVKYKGRVRDLRPLEHALTPLAHSQKGGGIFATAYESASIT